MLQVSYFSCIKILRWTKWVTFQISVQGNQNTTLLELNGASGPINQLTTEKKKKKKDESQNDPAGANKQNKTSVC